MYAHCPKRSMRRIIRRRPWFRKIPRGTRDISGRFFSAETACRVYDEFGAEDITKNADGTFTVDTAMPLNEWVYGYFLSYGDNVRILEPTALRETLRKKIEEMLKNYSEK